MPNNRYIKQFIDINFLEFSVVLPLILLMLFVGIYPNPFFQIINPAVNYNFFELLSIH